jgi:phosphoglycolate phosphatase
MNTSNPSTTPVKCENAAADPDRIIKIAFFDIGGTLGIVTGEALKLFPSTESMLGGFQAAGLKLGVITNVPVGWTKSKVKTLLSTAGILHFFDDAAIITSAEANASKPDLKIFQFAVSKAGTKLAQALFVGENPQEVQGAARAGMTAILKNVPS